MLYFKNPIRGIEWFRTAGEADGLKSGHTAHALDYGIRRAGLLRKIHSRRRRGRRFVEDASKNFRILCGLENEVQLFVQLHRSVVLLPAGFSRFFHDSNRFPKNTRSSISTSSSRSRSSVVSLTFTSHAVRNCSNSARVWIR